MFILDGENKNILGTYIFGEQTSEDALYIAFRFNGLDYVGNYFIYQQFQPLESGTFVSEGNNIYTLQSHCGHRSTQILHTNNRIYMFSSLFGAKHEILAFTRISDLAVFLNVCPSDFH